MTDETAAAVLNRFYAAEREYVATGGSDFGPMADCLHPDVVLYSMPGLPYGGIWRGHDGLQRFNATMSRAWESIEFLEQHQVPDGDRVAVFLKVRFRARATGRELETTILQLNTVVDGLITEFRPYYWDPAAITEVLDAR